MPNHKTNTDAKLICLTKTSNNIICIYWVHTLAWLYNEQGIYGKTWGIFLIYQAAKSLEFFHITYESLYMYEHLSPSIHDLYAGFFCAIINSQTCPLVTSIKQSPVLKGHFLFDLSWKFSYELNFFLEVTCLMRPLFLFPKVTSKYRFDCILSSVLSTIALILNFFIWPLYSLSVDLRILKTFWYLQSSSTINF